MRCLSGKLFIADDKFYTLNDLLLVIWKILISDGNCEVELSGMIVVGDREKMRSPKTNESEGLN